MRRLLFLPLLALLLSACSEAGLTASNPKEAPHSLAGFAYFGDKGVPCMLELGRVSRGKSSLAYYDCDFEGFYRTNPELLSDPSPNDRPDFESGEWMKVGDTPLFCFTYHWPYKSAKRSGAGYACDWPRWHALAAKNLPADDKSLKSFSMVGVAYRGEVLACGLTPPDVIRTGFMDSPINSVTCDFKGFYSTHPELLNEELDPKLDEYVHGSWYELEAGPIFCIREFVVKKEGKPTRHRGTSCDWVQWHAQQS